MEQKMNDLSADVRPEFHAERLTGLGGSDNGVVLGMSPFKTRLELYLEKRGELAPDFSDNSLTRAGRIMEQVIAAMYAEAKGVKVRKINRQLRHPDYPWMVGHIDRDVVGEKRGVEIKNVSPRIGYRWGKSGDPDGVAEYHLPQVHSYMLLMNYEVFDVAAYFGGDDLRIYPVERDPEWDEILIGAASDFWHHHVLAGVPPEPDFDHRSTIPLLSRLYPGTNGQTVEADEMIRHWAAVAQDAAAKATEYEAVAKSAKGHLLAFMGDAAVLSLGDGKAFRRKETKRSGYTVEPTSYMDCRFAKG
jgi:putative phage-type endonuclease